MNTETKTLTIARDLTAFLFLTIFVVVMLSLAGQSDYPMSQDFPNESAPVEVDR